ncbi:MAG: NAD(+)/NADH kinase [Actinobacteria bacterium]|nr:NAD(+)/NADH kinase [Actinomycetota bacterium]
MRRVGFVAHDGRPAAVEAAGRLVAWVRERGVATAALGAADRLGADDRLDAGPPTGPDPGPGLDLDLVVAVGGDGTFLRAAHLAGRADCPVLGVKVGRMGFLTEVEPDGAAEVIGRVLDGAAVIEERLALEAEPEGARWTGTQWALNEFIVEKATRHRVVNLAAYVDGTYVATLSGDGVIVASPTGSTAYSFSARGPIVSPTLPSLVVTPVAVHMVFDRSFVLGPGESVTLEVHGEEPGLISGDGRDSLELPVGSRVRIRGASRPARLVRASPPRSFYGLVREKFDLPGDPPGAPGGDVTPSG